MVIKERERKGRVLRQYREARREGAFDIEKEK
jgi:hypothetical protein